MTLGELYELREQMWSNLACPAHYPRWCECGEDEDVRIDGRVLGFLA